MDNQRKTAANVPRQAKGEGLARLRNPASVLHSVANAQKLLLAMQGDLRELESQIEEQRASRQEIEADLARYTSLYDLAPVACYTFDRNGVIQLANHCGADLLGRTRKQLQRHSFGTFLDDESAAAFSAFLQQVFATEGRQTCEVTLLPTQQHPARVMQIDAVADTGGQTCSAAALDITERKQGKLAAQQNYALLSRLSAQIPGILFQYRLDPDGTAHFPYVNESVPRTYDVTLEQARENAAALSSMVHPEDVIELKAAMLQSATTLSPWRHEFRMMRPDQDIVWRAVEANPEKLPDGSILWHGYTLDITERKRVEDELRLSEERWKFALEGADDGVWDWDLQSGKALYSRRWKEILGFAENEIGDTPDEWTGRLHPEDISRVKECQQTLIDQQLKKASLEFRLLCKDGDWKWIFGSCLVVGRNAAGRPLRLVGTLSDISERKQTEETLRQALIELEARRREAETLSEAKSRFLNAASHDLRQPLYATQLFIDAMRGEALTRQQQEIMANLRLSIEAMSAQLQMLLDVSRLDMGNTHVQLRRISIATICHHLERIYVPIAKEAEVQLRFHPRKAHVHTDLILITRLLGNLIDNAIKFAPRGSILVCARRCAQGVRFEVRDNGPGIPPEHRQRIFEEYYQIDNPERNQKAGLGLGLSIAQRISLLLNVPFGLQTQVGHGTVFSVTLPSVAATPASADNT